MICADWLWEAGWTKAFAAGAGGGMLRGGGFMASEYESWSASEALESDEEVDVEALVDWLVELWLDDAIQKAFDEKEWFEFVELVKSCKSK